MKTLNKETLNLLAKAATYIETWDIIDIADMYITKLGYTLEEVLTQYESDKTAYKTLVKQGYKIEEIKDLAQTPLQDCEVKEATIGTLKQCNTMVNFWTGKEESEQKTVVLKYWLKQKQLLTPKRKIETIVKDIKKAEDKLEVLQGYCDTYKQGHMECTNKRVGVWEPTAKNNNMQKTVYSKLSKLDDELKAIIEGLKLDDEKAIELLVEKGICIDIAYEMVTDWEV